MNSRSKRKRKPGRKQTAGCKQCYAQDSSKHFSKLRRSNK